MPSTFCVCLRKIGSPVSDYERLRSSLGFYDRGLEGIGKDRVLGVLRDNRRRRQWDRVAETTTNMSRIGSSGQRFVIGDIFITAVEVLWFNLSRPQMVVWVPSFLKLSTVRRGGTGVYGFSILPFTTGPGSVPAQSEDPLPSSTVSVGNEVQLSCVPSVVSESEYLLHWDRQGVDREVEVGGGSSGLFSSPSGTVIALLNKKVPIHPSRPRVSLLRL